MFPIKNLAVLALAVGAVASIQAQTVSIWHHLPAAELAVDYSYVRANAAPGQCGCFNMNGGSADVAVNAYRGVSAVFDLTGERAGITSIPNQPLSLVTFTAGPRYSRALPLQGRTRYTPFVQALVGATHGFDAPFPNGTSPTPTSATALAVFAGGGLDISLTARFAVRAVEADYGLSRLPNNVNDRQNLLRLSAGIVYRFRRSPSQIRASYPSRRPAKVSLFTRSGSGQAPGAARTQSQARP